MTPHILKIERKGLNKPVTLITAEGIIVLEVLHGALRVVLRAEESAVLDLHAVDALLLVAEELDLAGFGEVGEFGVLVYDLVGALH
jgi:hypothetical protein